MRVFHYTVGAYLDKIISARAIIPSSAFTPKKRERAVWFSSNPTWEQTANKMAEIDGKVESLDMEMTATIGGGLVRIEVVPKTAPFTFNDYIRIAKVPKRMRNALISSAKKMGGNPSEWFVSFRPVEAEQWTSIEIFNWPLGSWVSLQELIENKESILVNAA